MNSLDNFYIWVYYASSFEADSSLSDKQNKYFKTCREITAQKVNKYLEPRTPESFKYAVDDINEQIKKQIKTKAFIVQNDAILSTQLIIEAIAAQNDAVLPSQLMLKDYTIDCIMAKKGVVNFGKKMEQLISKYDKDMKENGHIKKMRDIISRPFVHVFINIIALLRHICINSEQLLKDFDYGDILENNKFDENLILYVKSMLFLIRITLTPKINKLKTQNIKPNWGILGAFMAYNKNLNAKLSLHFTLSSFCSKAADAAGIDNIVDRVSLAITYLNPMFLFLDYSD